MEIVMVNMITDPCTVGGSSHPIHLHRHTFHIHDVDYPEYGQFKRANNDIGCILEDGRFL